MCTWEVFWKHGIAGHSRRNMLLTLQFRFVTIWVLSVQSCPEEIVFGWLATVSRSRAYRKRLHGEHQHALLLVGSATTSARTRRRKSRRRRRRRRRRRIRRRRRRKKRRRKGKRRRKRGTTTTAATEKATATTAATATSGLLWDRCGPYHVCSGYRRHHLANLQCRFS